MAAVLAAVTEKPSHGYEITGRLGKRMGRNVDRRRVYEALSQLAHEQRAEPLCSRSRYLGSPLIGIDSYIPTSIHVGLCFYFKKSFKGKEQGLNCGGGEYYKRGSY